MKLQVNTSGAWKNVLSFSVTDVDQVRGAVETLGRAAASAENRISFRVLDSQETAVLMWDAGKGWHVPHWAKDHVWIP